jgi:hypothetical protein
MKTQQPYHHDLRVIGQSLEAQSINVFELKCEMGRYLVNGTPEKPTSLMGRLRQWRSHGRKNDARTMSYGAQEIEGLENLGRTRRSKPGGLPDFYNLSNLLRTVGGYLEAKNAELLRIQKQLLTVTLLYQNDGGHPHVEDRTIASFYEIFIGEHGKRARHAHL